MIKKLLSGCLFMTVLFLSSCDKQNNASQVPGSETSIETISIITCVIMAIALLAAYTTTKRR